MAIQNEEEMYLQKFAFCGTQDGLMRSIEALSKMAEDEVWTINPNEPNSVLFKYVLGTFKQCYTQDKLLYTANKSHCCFNTGLLTPNGNDILCVFRKNERQNAQPWVLNFFADKTERRYMDLFSDIPALATYTDNFEKFYFNPDYEIIVSTDHILDDNWERISAVVPLSKPIVKSLMVGVIEEAKIKIKRNIRLVVPQYYNNEIMYLLPIRIPISDDEYVTMALAIELTKTCKYRANTIFTKEMAYEKARLLMKPESNWLLQWK